jgi:phospholipase C
MIRVRGLIALLFLAFSGLAGCTSVTGAMGGVAPRHIFVIMMENQSYQEVIGNSADAPYINQLANQYGVASHYYGVTHPSLPNYLAAISGDYQGIFDDCKAGASVTCPPEEFVSSSSDFNAAQLLTPDEQNKAATQPHLFNGQTIVDQVESHHMTWKAYMQSMPSVGFTGEYYPVTTNFDGSTTPRKLYAQKHNPFEYFADIANNPARMQQIVPFTRFATDLQSDSLPNFVWISPDQCHDMHGVSQANAAALGIPNCYSPTTTSDPVSHSTIQLGDQFLSQLVPQIMGSKAWGEGAALVIAWDEDDYSGYAGCCGSPVGLNNTILGGADAPLLVISSSVKQHHDFTMPANHYTLLATIEKEWNLPCLANACAIKNSDLLTPLFQ